MLIQLQNGQVWQKDGSVASKDVWLLDGSILDILDPGATPPKPPEAVVDLAGHLVFPGLINCHDHLMDSFWPPIPGGPFATWQEWEAARAASPQHRTMNALSVADLYALGMYRNVLSGVTMIVDHFPFDVVQNFLHKPLVSICERFFAVHSMSPDRLPWGRDPADEFRQSRGVLPFLLHAGEGTIEDSHTEFQAMERQGLLGAFTILMNGPNIGESDFELLGSNNVKFVWCPNSAAANYGHQPDLVSICNHQIPVAIGTDSAISGSLNILEDLRTARAYIRENHPGLLSDLDLIRMVTSNPASFLYLEQPQGEIAKGWVANLIVFPDSSGNPLESFFSLKPGDFSMVIHQGRLVYGDDSFRCACAIEASQFSEIQVEGRAKIIHGKILQMLERIENKLGKQLNLEFLPVSRP